ncbi:MAG TPA: chemotaxis protein CheA [Chloroflexi bacterium]|nr:chemotaxis protein CheA [Chloroflexota bacterium]
MNKTLSFELETDELDIFLQDVNENLQALESGILRLEKAADADALNATFRAAHTIKAVVATVGHRRMAEMLHTLETIFDAMREGELALNQAVTDELLVTVDVLKAMRDEVITREPCDVDVDACLDRLRFLAEGGMQDLTDETPAPIETVPLTPEQLAQVEAQIDQGAAVLDIEITTRASAFAQGARLLQASMRLAEIGEIVAQRPTQVDLTEGRQSGHMWLILSTYEEASVVEGILGSVTDLAEFRIRPYGATDGPFADTPVEEPEGASKDLEEPELDQSMMRRSATDGGKQDVAEKTVSISIERLDALMNLVGELVTDRTRLIQIRDTFRSRREKDGVSNALTEMTTHFERVVDRLQEEVMAARMLPISHLFRRFPRLVRDVARAGEKHVNLVIEGEATELDRSVIEVINDPLIHLLRNAVDHGIEAPQARIAAGKPPAGTIWLTAAHEEGHIVVTVKDNGRGIDPDVIRRTAVQRGLLTEEEAAQLDDEAAINLIFQPNLSTAEQVTDVSGRGVGLDVVRTNIKRLSGSVVVESEIGEGATFRVTLPLTLAIVQAMLVVLGGDVYAIPLSGIVESLYLAGSRIDHVRGKAVIQWRGQILPLVRLRQVFTHRGLVEPVPTGQEAVVVISWGRLQVGLVVDELIGKQEIVIKSLGPFIGSVTGISGCTIMGDGRIALIVDVPGLIGATMKIKSGGISGEIG